MPKKKLFHTIFIACEGKNTEPHYLGRIVEAMDEERRISVTIFPKPKFVPGEEGEEGIEEEHRRSDPVGLVEEAQRRLSEGFDEAWAVFDKDGHTGVAKAFQLATEATDGKRVNIAFSSIAFEHWVLLHFERNTTAFLKSKNIIDECFLSTGSGFFPNYAKRRETDIYPVLKDKTLTAIENSAWLRQQMQAALENGDGKFYELNPYTDADCLVKKLLDIPLEFTWANYNEDAHFAGFTIRASQGGNAISIHLSNHTERAFVLNPGNTANYFFLHNYDYSLQIAQTVMIAPGNSAVIELNSEVPLPNTARLVFQVENERLLIE